MRKITQNEETEIQRYKIKIANNTKEIIGWRWWWSLYIKKPALQTMQLKYKYSIWDYWGKEVKKTRDEEVVLLPVSYEKSPTPANIKTKEKWKKRGGEAKKLRGNFIYLSIYRKRDFLNVDNTNYIVMKPFRLYKEKFFDSVKLTQLISHMVHDICRYNILLFVTQVVIDCR